MGAASRGRLAQWLEHAVHIRGVTGSNPVSPTTPLIEAPWGHGPRLSRTGGRAAEVPAPPWQQNPSRRLHAQPLERRPPPTALPVRDRGQVPGPRDLPADPDPPALGPPSRLRPRLPIASTSTPVTRERRPGPASASRSSGSTTATPRSRRSSGSGPARRVSRRTSPSTTSTRTRRRSSTSSTRSAGPRSSSSTRRR